MGEESIYNADSLWAIAYLDRFFYKQLKKIEFKDNKDVNSKKTYYSVAKVRHFFPNMEEERKKKVSMLQQYEIFYKELYLLIHDKAFSYLKNKDILGKSNIYTEHIDTFNEVVKTILFVIKKIMKGETIAGVDFSIYLNDSESISNGLRVMVSSNLYMVKKEKDYYIYIIPSVSLAKKHKNGHYSVVKELLKFECEYVNN